MIHIKLDKIFLMILLKKKLSSTNIWFQVLSLINELVFLPQNFQRAFCLGNLYRINLVLRTDPIHIYKSYFIVMNI